MADKDREIVEGPEAFEQFERLARGVAQVPKEEADALTESKPLPPGSGLFLWPDSVTQTEQ